ncbi:MAG: ATP-binding protein [Gammaproteobacteria bacterium SHHR-1]|uniref:sensor histidine kinase n=1 Tax=Magnetovirga frankeli TaxID=947516 RepID=UPI001292F915|nr:hypothetical protein D5125_04590 [gamma proteobacterium SS-5]
MEPSAPDEQWVFIRVQSKGALTLRAFLMGPQALAAETQRVVLIQGGYLAITLTLTLINGLLALRLRDLFYGWYSAYIATLCFGYLGIEGMLRLLWPAAVPLFGDFLVALATGLGFATFALFIMRLFETRRRNPRIHRGLQAVVALGVLSFLSGTTPYYNLFVQPLATTGLFLVFLYMGMAWMHMRQGLVAGRLFFSAFSITAVGAMITFMGMLGLLPSTELTRYALQYSSVFHMILMTLALSERVLAAEAAALEAAQAAEGKAVALAREMTRNLVEKQAQLQEALTSEQTLRAEQRQFIDTISHEYRTPLSIVRTHLDVLDGKGRIEQERMAVLNKAMGRLQGLFSEALQTHRQGRPPQVRLQRVDLAPLLNGAVADFRQLHPDCPIVYRPLSEPLPLMLDPGLFQVVVENLLGNASRYRYPVDGAYPVELELVLEADAVRLRFGNAVDPGKPLQREALFERFVRGATGGGRPGMGLGLYLVRRIVQDMSGEVHILDTPRDRFLIEVCLPRQGGATGQPAGVTAA